MAEIVLKTDGLTKRYKYINAVDNVSLTINKGDIYGFVGLNGSGKTTFIRMVTSLIRPTAGSFTLFGTQGLSSVKQLNRVSSMVETPSLYLDLSAIDNLKVQCKIANVDDTDTPFKLLQLVGLDPLSKKPAKQFSLGMRQRLGIAVALVGNPEFMLLDEPTNGLDPEGIVQIRELLQKLNREMGITILVSSHILSELGKLATRFGFIHRGKLIKEASLEEIKHASAANLNLETDNNLAAMELLNGKYSYSVNNGAIVIAGDATVAEITALMTDEGINIYNIGRAAQDLEGYFINLIGGKK